MQRRKLGELRVSAMHPAACLAWITTKKPDLGKVVSGVMVFITMLVAGAAVAMESGFQVETFEDSNRQRPIAIDWWYPVDAQSAPSFDYGLGQGRVIEAGALAPGKFPLVVLSHGALGAARNYSWIAESLARHGYIVAGISHFGESYVHGNETVDPTAVLRSWERPLDISAAISYVLTQSEFSQSIDEKRIGFIGHSSGGATAMSLAGVLFDGAKIAQYCASADSAGDRGCDYARTSSTPSSNRVTQPKVQSYADPRIRVFVALDPALGPAFFDFSDIDPHRKMLIVGSVNNDFLPFKHHAKKLAENYPNAKLHALNNSEGHFVYLNECNLDIQANTIPLCIDRKGVSRAAVHDVLRALILPFLGG